jgi:hypothetical protein
MAEKWYPDNDAEDEDFMTAHVKREGRSPWRMTALKLFYTEGKLRRGIKDSVYPKDLCDCIGCDPDHNKQKAIHALREVCVSLTTHGQGTVFAGGFGGRNGRSDDPRRYFVASNEAEQWWILKDNLRQVSGGLTNLRNRGRGMISVEYFNQTIKMLNKADGKEPEKDMLTDMPREQKSLAPAEVRA